MQLHTDPGMRGRVMALYLMVFMGGTPLGSPLIGWVGEAYGARWTLIAGGAATVVGVAVAAIAYLRIGHHHITVWERRSPARPHGRGRPGRGGEARRCVILSPAPAAGNLGPRAWQIQALTRARISGTPPQA